MPSVVVCREYVCQYVAAEEVLYVYIAIFVISNIMCERFCHQPSTIYFCPLLLLNNQNTTDHFFNDFSQ